LYKLLLKKKLDTDNKDIKDPYLIRILIIAKTILKDLYRLYSDISLDRKIT
jgi:hypothetical protein